MGMFQAIDTFVAELKDGSALHVAKGAVFHDSHELVKRDRDKGLLFKAIDDGEPENAAPKEADPAPEPVADPIPVADQKAAGVPPEETVTIAEQKAGTPPPELPLSEA